MLMYYAFTPESVFKSVWLKAQTWLDKPVCYAHNLLIYVNETIYLYGNLPFFKIHVNHFMARDDSPGAKIISKCILWVRGLVSSSEFWDISSL